MLVETKNHRKIIHFFSPLEIASVTEHERIIVVLLINNAHNIISLLPSDSFSRKRKKIKKKRQPNHIKSNKTIYNTIQSP